MPGDVLGSRQIADRIAVAGGRRRSSGARLALGHPRGCVAGGSARGRRACRRRGRGSVDGRGGARACARRGALPAVELSAEHVALSFQSERHVLIDGRSTGAGFAPLSRLVRCANGGWLRTHGNYPHHAAAIGRALGIDVSGDQQRAAERLAQAALTAEAIELESAVIAAGGCAAALRHPTAMELAPGRPSGRSGAARGHRARAGGRLGARAPAAGRPRTAVRGHSRARSHARHRRPGRCPHACGAGRRRAPGRSAAPARDPRGARRHRRGKARRDARSCGRRATGGSARGRACAGDRVPAGRAGAVSDWTPPTSPNAILTSCRCRCSAWGTTGPWGDRRGFDSLVQVASGIATECAAGDGTPGVLPAQALDHATGHLVAAAALRALAMRAAGEATGPARLSLARTAQELLRAPRPEVTASSATGAADPAAHRVTFGRVSLIAPPGTLDGRPLRWAARAARARQRLAVVDRPAPGA